MSDCASLRTVVAVGGLALEDEHSEGGSLVFQSLQFYRQQIFPLFCLDDSEIVIIDADQHIIFLLASMSSEWKILGNPILIIPQEVKHLKVDDLNRIPAVLELLKLLVALSDIRK